MAQRIENWKRPLFHLRVRLREQSDGTMGSMGAVERFDLGGRKNYGKDGRGLSVSNIWGGNRVVACLPGVFHAIRISGADGHRDGRDSITDSNQLGKRDSLSTSTSFVCVHRHHLMNLVGRTFRSNKESNLEISLFLYVLCVSVLILKLYSVDMYTTKAASNENKRPIPSTRQIRWRQSNQDNRGLRLSAITLSSHFLHLLWFVLLFSFICQNRKESWPHHFVVFSV